MTLPPINSQKILSFIAEKKITHCMEISRALEIDHSYVNRILHKLKNKGVITFTWKPSDGRINYLELSEYGEQVLA